MISHTLQLCLNVNFFSNQVFINKHPSVDNFPISKISRSIHLGRSWVRGWIFTGFYPVSLESIIQCSSHTVQKPQCFPIFTLSPRLFFLWVGCRVTTVFPSLFPSQAAQTAPVHSIIFINWRVVKMFLVLFFHVSHLNSQIFLPYFFFLLALFQSSKQNKWMFWIFQARSFMISL